MELKLGVSREIITPKLGGYFLGYGSKSVSDSVNDDLTVTVFTFSYGEIKSMLISVCVCLVANELSDEIRSACGKVAGVPVSNVILSCTHTHSGPYTENFDDMIDETYINDIFIPRCVAAAKASIRTMTPVKMGVASIDTRIGINRRQILSNNEVILGNNSWGPYDPELTVLSFKDDLDRTIANIIHVGAHCTASGINTEVTRDWAGYMIDRLEIETGGAMTAFVNGALGDVAPRMANGQSTGDLKLAMELGGFAGAEAVRAYKNIRVYKEEDMSVALGEIRIPNEPLLSRERVNGMLEEIKAIPGFETERFLPGRISKLEAILRFHESGEGGEDEFAFDQVLIRIGPVVFIPLPFEVSTEISMRLREYSKYGYTLMLSCSNGSNSYLPTEDQMCRGGYEVESFQWARIRRLPDNTDWYIVSQNCELMDNL